MTENQVSVALTRLSPYVSSAAYGGLRSHLQAADEHCMDGLMTLKLKSRTTAILLALFLGALGVGRFYLGNTGLGVARIVATIVTNVLLVFLPIAGLIAYAAIFIWHITDIFLVAKKVKYVNYDTVCIYLNSHTAR